LDNNTPQNFADIIDTMTPEIYANLKRAVELGKWETGQKLSQAQIAYSLQAIIAYEHKYVSSENHTAYIASPSCGKPASKT